MDTSKLYEKCDVVRRTSTITAGEETFTETTVYSQIPCYKRNMRSSTHQSTVEQDNVQVVYFTIDVRYTVQTGDIFIFDGVRYKADEVKKYGLISNANNKVKCNRI